MPQAKVIAVATEDIVPSAVGMRCQAVGLALVVGIDSCNRFTHKPLNAHEHRKHSGIGNGQTCIDSNTQHQSVENQTKKEFQIGF